MGASSPCIPRSRPFLLCGFPGGGQSRTQSPWLSLEASLCPLAFVCHRHPHPSSSSGPTLWPKDDPESGPEPRAALKSKPASREVPPHGVESGERQRLSAVAASPACPSPQQMGKRQRWWALFPQGPQAPEPFGVPSTAVRPSEPCHCLSWGARWGRCALGPLGLPRSPSAEPRRLSPPLCLPARTTPHQGSWRAGQGPEGLGNPVPIGVFGLQLCTPGKGSTECGQ